MLLRHPAARYAAETVVARTQQTYRFAMSIRRPPFDYLTTGELNSRREMISDPGQIRVLRPADVIVRVVTHIFNHQGQVPAMCRALGRPHESNTIWTIALE